MSRATAQVRRDWIVCALLVLVGAVLRLYRLGAYDVPIFDEVYYVRGAYSLMAHGVEYGASGTGAQMLALFQHGDLSVLTEPSMASHPPLGKWIIAVGLTLFGHDMFGARAMVALLGAATVGLVYWTVRRLGGGTLAAAVAAAVFAVDGVGVVLGRVGMLDGILAFFIAWMVFVAARLLTADVVRRRDMLLLGAVIGAGTAVKWSAAPVGAGLLALVLCVMWRRRVAGRDAERRVCEAGLAAVVTYALSWTGWFMSSDGYGRTWGADNPIRGLGWLDAVRSWVHLHVTLVESMTAYQASSPDIAPPSTWPLLNRATLMFDSSTAPTFARPNMCEGGECVARMVAAGLPTVWWLGGVALLLWAVFGGRRAALARAVVAVGVASTWLIWFAATRDTYAFYQVAILPFLSISCGFCVEWAWRATERWYVLRAVGAGVLLGGTLWQVLVSLPLWLGLPRATPVVPLLDAWYCLYC